MSTRNSVDRNSTEYVRVPVTAPTGVTLGTQPVSIAVVDGRPETGDWVSATWEGSMVKALVGAGGIVRAPGTWNVWIKITDSPEIPVFRAGSIRVT